MSTRRTHKQAINVEEAIRADVAKQRPIKLRKGQRSHPKAPSSTSAQILAWADAYHARTGVWPTILSGRIHEEARLTWSAVNARLRVGHGSLPGGSSLAKLLAAERGRRHHLMASRLTTEQIVIWADEYRTRAGSWPRHDSETVPGAEDESWTAIDNALRIGLRGLPGRSSLAQLLSETRGVRNYKRLADFSIDQILEWADAYRDRHGAWPRRSSGDIPESPDDTWHIVGKALTQGQRGLPGGTSLELLLNSERGARSYKHPPLLTVETILEWSDAHTARTGRPARSTSGAVKDAQGESWAGIDLALRRGTRGLPGGSSLARLLAESRNVRNEKATRPLSEDQIARWAASHYERNRRYPVSTSGQVEDATGETWSGVNSALSVGRRGLEGGTSLAELLHRKFGVHRGRLKPNLTVGQICDWINAHRRRNGRNPDVGSGPIVDAPGETWSRIDYSLHHGRRGLDSGSSLARVVLVAATLSE